MPFRHSMLGFVLAIPVAGCAIHPLPEDYVGLNTNAIVYHIRCEARDSIATAIGSYLSTQSGPDREIGLRILNRPNDIDKIDFKPLSVAARANIDKYRPAAIAMDFTFDMSEDNDVSSQVDVLDTFTHHVLSIGVKAESDHQRQTIRQFRINSTFNDLIGKGSNCGAPRPPDFNYPIAGNIGLEEMIKTFVDLNQFEGLTGKDSKDAVPQLADTLVFQTNLSGSISPKVTLTPVKLGPRLTDASLSGSGFRKDDHKVIVGLSLPPAKGAALKPKAGYFFGADVGRSFDAFSRTSAQTLANDLVDEQIQRNIINTLAVRPSQ